MWLLLLGLCGLSTGWGHQPSQDASLDILKLGDALNKDGDDKSTGASGKAFAVNGDPRLRNQTATKPPRRHKNPDTVVQYNQKVPSLKENKAKADLARRVTVKDKVREIGKPRPKTGVVVPVLESLGYETLLADFIKYGCERPPPGTPQLGADSTPEAPRSGVDLCEDARTGESAICQLHGDESQLCKQLRSTNLQHCAVVNLKEAGSPPAMIAPCHASCKECAGKGPKKCTVCACLLYTSDAADDLLCVDLGGRRILKKKKKKDNI
eukprot:TRINITY_DN5172_c0_g1_i2.p1 TRINITY_DN5172_c0_g1~~TRINITY_DN5172_c0_g1_i2.p1  ORF type:complete len:267 (+),score=48.94 TRINITY_DN5172_c0_g1_i2:171-971(+)